MLFVGIIFLYLSKVCCNKVCPVPKKSFRQCFATVRPETASHSSSHDDTIVVVIHDIGVALKVYAKIAFIFRTMSGKSSK